MSLEHPYRSIYLDQTFRSQVGRRRNGHYRPQAYRRPRRYTWVERLIGAALLLAAAVSLLLAVLLALGVIWLISQVVQEIARGWRG